MKWLIARRATQIAILLLFLIGPWFGWWIVKGNLASSLTLDILPLTDPFLLLQTLAAGHWPYRDALLGVAIVVAFYLLVGGRSYCAWVCPVNMVTDAAGWLRNKLGLKGGHMPHPATRYWLLAGVLAAAAITGMAVWEFINPVSMTQRALIFGSGFAWMVVLAVFLYDLLLAPRGWCGHVCPMGACYSLLGHTALVRVSAYRREACDDCMDCFHVCPEPQVIRPALKGAGQDNTPLILDAQCTNCGRCIDVCQPDVFRFTTRFDRRTQP
ncbi:MAG: quinol dehydrogenase ferredoxin subunit NapH [Zoogloeaceae bacterium]|jgi:ferredoxin-type protein NapH|nr:quinol dehydrogenase ferredoxin subunit NapH [Zoogloeaceae bacterium]